MGNYNELISKISNEIVFVFIKKEENLSSRALLLDADIVQIVNSTFGLGLLSVFLDGYI